MKLKLETIEPKLRERIERQMRQEDALRRNDPRSYPVDSDKIESPPIAPKRLRQKEGDGMNKLESSWLVELKIRFPSDVIRSQSVRLKIANGVTLTPDFMIFKTSERSLAWEVKGPHAWEDSLIKLKVAASVYPEFIWILVWKVDGQWKEQIVLP